MTILSLAQFAEEIANAHRLWNLANIIDPELGRVLRRMHDESWPVSTKIVDINGSILRR